MRCLRGRSFGRSSLIPSGDRAPSLEALDALRRVFAVTMLATKGGSTFGGRTGLGLRAVTMRGLSVVMAG